MSAARCKPASTTRDRKFLNFALNSSSVIGGSPSSAFATGGFTAAGVEAGTAVATGRSSMAGGGVGVTSPSTFFGASLSGMVCLLLSSIVDILLGRFLQLDYAVGKVIHSGDERRDQKLVLDLPGLLVLFAGSCSPAIGTVLAALCVNRPARPFDDVLSDQAHVPAACRLPVRVPVGGVIPQMADSVGLGEHLQRLSARVVLDIGFEAPIRRYRDRGVPDVQRRRGQI